MSVRKRIYLLLAAVVLVFAAALFWLWMLDRQQYAAMERDQLRERKESFDRFLQQSSSSLETFVNDYSRSDGLVNAIKNGDRAWVDSNLGGGTSNNSRAHVFWVYRPDKTLFSSRNSLYSSGLDEVPIARAAFDNLFVNQKEAHFFAKTPAGILEIYGAPVHASRDKERTGPPEGFFFAGRLWNPEELKEMSLNSGNNLSIVDPKYSAENLVLPHGAVAFTHSLLNADGQSVGQLLVRYDPPLVEQVSVLRWRMWVWVLAFTLTLLSVLTYALRRWVWQPLYRLSKSLRAEDPTLIRAFDEDRTEVGDLARMIRSFFEQREALLREMRDRRQAEKALHDSEEQLRHSQKMEAIGRLAGGVAHDFNNLLTAIIGYAGMLRDRLSRDAASREDAEEILKAGDRAAALTRQLLAFGRKQVLHPRVLDLNTLVLDMDHLIRRVIGEHIELRVSAEAPQSYVRADRAQVEQVLLNLVVNARDAMPRGGIMTIATASTLIPEVTVYNGIRLPAGRYVTLEVTDTGTGMDEATRERIFEPFFTTKPAGQGTGLGLASVHGTVQQSGGAIALASTPGKGTSFLVHLPLVLEAEPEPEAPQYTSVVFEGTPEGETILVLEDEPAVRGLVTAVLKEQGYRVLCAENADAARRLESANRGSIRLLVTDVVMPKTNGPEIAAEFKAANPQMEVLFMSGYSDDPAMEASVLASDLDVLEKPFTPLVLLERVRELLARKASGKFEKEESRASVG